MKASTRYKYYQPNKKDIFVTVEYNGTRYTVDPRKIKMQG